MNNIKQAVATAILAGSMALTFVAGASADGPKPGGSVPTGTVTFFVNGASSTASFNPYEIAVAKKVPFTTPQGAPLEEVPLTLTTWERIYPYDNEWRYVAIRRQ
jgi:hypothetical protein